MTSTQTDQSLTIKDVQCSICLNILNNPTTLNCGHNFCIDCLVVWQNRNLINSSSSRCTLCNAEIRQMEYNKNIVLSNIINTLFPCNTAKNKSFIPKLNNTAEEINCKEIFNDLREKFQAKLVLQRPSKTENNVYFKFFEKNKEFSCFYLYDIIQKIESNGIYNETYITEHELERLFIDLREFHDRYLIYPPYMNIIINLNILKNRNDRIRMDDDEMNDDEMADSIFDYLRFPAITHMSLEKKIIDILKNTIVDYSKIYHEMYDNLQTYSYDVNPTFSVIDCDYDISNEEIDTLIESYIAVYNESEMNKKMMEILKEKRIDLSTISNIELTKILTEINVSLGRKTIENKFDKFINKMRKVNVLESVGVGPIDLEQPRIIDYDSDVIEKDEENNTNNELNDSHRRDPSFDIEIYHEKDISFPRPLSREDTPPFDIEVYHEKDIPFPQPLLREDFNNTVNNDNMD